MVLRPAISYSRFSHRRQKKGSSTERQEALLAEYLRRNPDIDLIHSFADKGMSGFRGKHAQKGDLARLIGMLERNELPRPIILIIESVDRLSREPVLDALDRFSALLKLGVTIHVCDKGWDLSRENLSGNGVGNLFTLIGAMTEAHDSSSRKSDWVVGGWAKQVRQARATGLAVKGYVGPPWVSIDPKTQRYVIGPDDEATVTTVRSIYRMRIDGISDHGIAKLLNERGVPVVRAHMPADRKRQGWYQSYVSDLLKNRQVLGEQRFFDSDQVILNYFPQIITPEEFERAQSSKNSRDSHPGRKGKDLANLFTGLAKCHHCGGAMQMTRNQKAKYLMCSNRKRRFECSSTGMIRYDKVEATILDSLPDIPWDKILRTENPGDPVPALRESVAQIEAEITVLKTEQKRAAALIVKDPAFEEEVGPIIAERRQQIAEAKGRLTEQTTALIEAETIRSARPHLQATAIECMRQIAEASEAERFVLRTRLAHTIAGMITGMALDTQAKTISVTFASRYARATKLLATAPPEHIGSKWMTQPQPSVPWQEIAIEHGGIFDPDLFEHLPYDAMERTIAARDMKA